MKYVVPLVLFFPALMPGNNVIGGNVAYILYGLLFPGAILGWKKGVWRWFYPAVLVASFFKAPFLTLLAIPVFAGKRQWLKAAAVGAAGLGLFAAQSWLWPTQFHEYLMDLNLSFQFNSDFGLSPAGVLARALQSRGLPYTTLPALAYGIYGGVVFAALWHFSQLYHQGRISGESWIPVLMVGTILLNPRIALYDVLPVTLPMALIVVRSVASRSKAGIAVAVSLMLLILADLFLDLANRDLPRDMCVLVAVMGLGLQYVAAEARSGLPRIGAAAATSEPAVAKVEA